MKFLHIVLAIFLLNVPANGQNMFSHVIADTVKKDTSNTGMIRYKSAPVDTRGRALDTDGDGIPDYKDKELLTQQRCFPVDTNGVGVCPEPSCCKIGDPIDNSPINCSMSPVFVKFAAGDFVLNSDNEKELKTLVSKMNGYPMCHLAVGTVSGGNKAAINLAWKRVKAVIDYLVKQGIGEERIGFSYDLGDLNVVEITSRNREPGPPAPTPKKNR